VIIRQRFPADCRPIFQQEVVSCHFIGSDISLLGWRLHFIKRPPLSIITIDLDNLSRAVANGRMEKVCDCMIKKSDKRVMN